jgi:hypothetical protein
MFPQIYGISGFVIPNLKYKKIMNGVQNIWIMRGDSDLSAASRGLKGVDN